jgi:predicted nucleotidyltransferase
MTVQFHACNLSHPNPQTSQNDEMMISLESYRQSRDVLLTRIVTELSNDERFAAAWLTGSYGREDADEVSDLDLHLVVAEPYSASLCSRQEQVSHRTAEARFTLFSKFGTPALIHENNNNAPEGGTFTFVLYAESALMIDWTLIPLVKAKRPYASRLLFDKTNIPVSPSLEPEDLEQSRKSVAEQWTFFWMMTAITIKYIIRGDHVFVTRWLEELHGISHEIERRISRLPLQYTRGSLSQFQPTREKQIESIHQLCRRMQNLIPKVEQFIGTVLVTPIKEIETLLLLANE